MGLKGYRLWVNFIQRAAPHHELADQRGDSDHQRGALLGRLSVAVLGAFERRIC
jgi:hypothetical protein